MEPIPEALEAAQHPREPNAEIPLFEGPLRFQWEGGEAPGEGKIWWQWLPAPGLQFEADVTGNIWRVALEGRTRITPEGWSTAKALVTQSGMSDLGSDRHRVAGRLITETVEGDPTAEVDEITFELTNYHVDQRGRPIRVHAEGERQATWHGRALYPLGEWFLTLDRVYEVEEAARQVGTRGGFAVTHVGSLAKSDGSLFRWEDAQSVLQALHFWFAFTRALWVGPALVEGRRVDESVLKVHTSTNLSRYRGARSWCPRLHGQDELEETATRFVELWDGGLGQVFQHAVWWYVEATATQAQDSKIVLVHSALELLGWVELVERRGLLSVDGFTRLTAADQLRLLLGHLGVPRKLPDELGELQGYAAARNREDGPDAFYGIRNALVHPSLKKRQEIAQAPGRTRFEAAELGLYYVEMALLSMLGHRGPVLHRVSARWRGEEHPVPWANLDE